MTRYSRRSMIAGALSTTIVATGARRVGAADDAQEAEQLVEKSRLTFESFMTDSNLGALKDLLKQARGLVVAPAVLRGAFFIGASGGSGVIPKKQGALLALTNDRLERQLAAENP